MIGKIYHKDNEWLLEYTTTVNNVSMLVNHRLHQQDVTLEIQSKYKANDKLALDVEFELVETTDGETNSFEIVIHHIEGDFTWSEIFKKYHDTYRSHFKSFEQWLEANYYVPKKKNK